MECGLFHRRGALFSGHGVGGRLCQCAPGTPFGITATDISRAALSLAKNGIYSARKLDFIPPALREKYLLAVEDGRLQIHRALRERVCFNQANLLDINDMPAVQVDLIYCQNLLVYFRRWLREKFSMLLCSDLNPVAP